MQIDTPIIVLVGPTAIGKTALSFQLADRFDCEIISMDSMQVYRYMDIGTAKPTKEERKQFPHHLLDIVDPDEQYNAARFVDDCLSVIGQISARGKIPLVTGGTGLYLSSLLNGLFDIVQVSDEVRVRLKQRFCRPGAPDPYEELCRIDPMSAARIHKNDRQRVLRGLEIYHSTGIPWSDYLKKQQKKESSASFSRLFAVYLNCPRDILYKRIDRRTDSMLAQGFVEEVEGLRHMGYGPELTSMQSIGYRHVNQFLDGNWDREMMKSLLARDTRRYAKRQMTWFRRIDRLRPYGRDDQNKIIADIYNYFQKNSK